MTTSGFDIVLKKFDVDHPDELTEQQLVEALAQRISEMLDTQTELLFSTLYRLDIYESKINAVLDSDIDNAMGLAQLVIDRQKEKLRTKEEYRQKGDAPDFIDV